jgi:tetratricopeptide (TPR) repeat protein
MTTRIIGLRLCWSVIPIELRGFASKTTSEVQLLAEDHPMHERAPVIVAGVMALLVTSAAPGQTPSAVTDPQAAPGLRVLTGDDAKQAEVLDKAIEASCKAGQWDEAIAKARKLLALRTRVQGPKHFETVNAEWRAKTLRLLALMTEVDRVALQSARTMAAEANAAYDKGKYAQAHPLFEKTLSIRRRLLTDDHPDTAESYNKLGMSLWRLGKYAEAEPLLEKSLAIRRRLLTDVHPDTAAAYNNLALDLKYEAKYEQAQSLYEKALAIRRELFGDEGLETSESYLN